jgi:hypothetical protein
MPPTLETAATNAGPAIAEGEFGAASQVANAWAMA